MIGANAHGPATLAVRSKIGSLIKNFKYEKGKWYRRDAEGVTYSVS